MAIRTKTRSNETADRLTSLESGIEEMREVVDSIDQIRQELRCLTDVLEDVSQSLRNLNRNLPTMLNQWQVAQKGE